MIIIKTELMRRLMGTKYLWYITAIRKGCFFIAYVGMGL
jgi:hypothetical protein